MNSKEFIELNKKCKNCIYLWYNRCPIKESGDYKDVYECNYKRPR